MDTCRHLMFILWLLPVPALSSTFVQCANDTFDPDVRIRACTVFLQGRQLLPENAANAYNNRAVAHHHKGDFRLAIADYDRALEEVANNAHIFNNRGNAYQALGDHIRALLDYSKAIRLNQWFASAYNNRGSIYRNNKQYDLAIEDYNKAILIEPRMTIAFYNRAYTYRLLGEFELATQDYNRAIELDANYVKAYIGRGRLFSLQKNYQQALDDYNQALRIAPEDAYARNNRGHLYQQQGRLVDAIQDYQKAIELQPRNAEFYNNLSWLLATTPECYRGESAVELAQHAIRIAAKVEDGTAKSFYYDTLAAAYAKVGRFNKALSAQQLAIERMRGSIADDHLAGLEGRLKLYKNQQPYIVVNKPSVSP